MSPLAPKGPFPKAMRLVILYDNVGQPPFREGWGFSVLITHGERKILFDTGADRLILAHNLQSLGLDLSDLTDLFLSHPHCDHMGGLSYVLERIKRVRIWAPEGMARYLRQRMKKVKAELNIISEPTDLGDGLFSTGTMGRTVREQGLIVKTKAGGVLITGCAHPGVDFMAERARNLIGSCLSLVLGGFHLEGVSKNRLKVLVSRLGPVTEALAPGHCTGKEAIEFLCASFPSATPLAVGKTFSWEENA